MPELRSIHRWEIAAPRGLVHVVHGMAEHGLRYARLAGVLNAAGYTVWAHDHRGHGLRPGEAEGDDDRGHFGDSRGWDTLVDDTRSVSEALRHSSPRTPLVLFAHSMGSFVVQTLLGLPAPAYAAVVLSGSNGPPRALETSGLALARAERGWRGPRAPGRWLQRLVFGMYNREFAPTRTGCDWLSRDAAEVDAYLADPLCGFPLSAGAWVDFLEGKRRLGDAVHLAAVPKDLPIRLIAGTRDPVGEMGSGVRRLRDLYVGAGVRDVSLKLYEDARHELVNEINRDEVMRDLVQWLDVTVGNR